MTNAGATMFGYRPELSRRIGLADLVFYGLIFMVPIAPFAIFGQVYSASAGMPVLAYLLGLVVLLLTAASYGQMVKAFPLAGSVYNYAGRGIGAPVGFLAGWAILLDYILVPGLLYLVASVAMNASVPQIPVWGWLLGFVAANTIVNLRGIRMSMGFIKFMIIAELGVLATFLGVAGWALAHGRGRSFSFAPLFDGNVFSWPVVAAAASIAILSFLGFDGIAMLAEESKGGPAQVGRAMKLALGLAGLLFIAQVWVAALLVPDPAGVIASGDAGGTAFYDAAEAAGGHWLMQVTSIATAIAWGLADTLVAQVAVARLLYAMARDRQLPSFLAKVSPKYAVPANATLLVAVLSLGLGLWMSTRGDGINLLASLINMGAMIAFLVLHLAVIVHYMGRQRSRNVWSHLVVPMVGGGILVYVAIHANLLAQTVGLIWLGAGVVVLIGLYVAGRRPSLQPVAALAEGARG